MRLGHQLLVDLVHHLQRQLSALQKKTQTQDEESVSVATTDMDQPICYDRQYILSCLVENQCANGETKTWSNIICTTWSAEAHVGNYVTHAKGLPYHLHIAAAYFRLREKSLSHDDMKMTPPAAVSAKASTRVVHLLTSVRSSLSRSMTLLCVHPASPSGQRTVLP